MVFEEVPGWLAAFGIQLIDVLEAVVILLVGLFLVRATMKGLTRALAKRHFPELQRELLLRTARVFLIIIVVGLALTPLHLNLSSLVVGFGVVGVVVWLGFAPALSNIAAGILIAASRVFNRGDKVIIANQEGIVEHLGLITTALRTSDNRRIDVPNTVILNNPIVHLDAHPRRRVDVAVEIPLGQDIPGFLRALRQATSNLLAVPGEGATPEVVLKGMSDRTVTVEVQAWALEDRGEETREALVTLIKETMGRVKEVPRAYGG